MVAITLCMFLYCCCCQRRPEIHDGIKLMWVRRSFGKECKLSMRVLENKVWFVMVSEPRIIVVSLKCNFTS